MKQTLFLPVCRQDMLARNWKGIDILLVTGDAYVDHPAFGVAIIGRVLEAEGYRVAVLPQPDWRQKEVFLQFGRPALFVGITSGNLDSMLAHYTAAVTPRRSDAYSPGGLPERRPDRATVVYANRVRECFPGIPIVLGGIEASLRRLAHYDYWSNSVRRSILIDSRANWVAYGMAETAVKEIARLLAAGKSPESICSVPGTVWVTSDSSRLPAGSIFLPSEEEVRESKTAFLKAFRLWYNQLDPRFARPVVQPTGNRYLVQMPAPLPLSPSQLDAIYSLPFTRQAHPSYGKNIIPALATVETSITSHRGCSGGCAFCSLAMHQGRLVQSRCPDSILQEAGFISRQEWFRGTISDIGGPTANLYGAKCLQNKAVCQRESCLYPSICEFFSLDGSQHLFLLHQVSRLRQVKHVFVETGIRHDIVLRDTCQNYLEELCRWHVGGHLRVAPEHISKPVLDCMRKSLPETFEEFRERFKFVCRKAKKELYLAPYFMSGHPACKISHMIELAEYLHRFGFFIEQVQDFIPLPMTLSACIFWTGRDPLTGHEVYTCSGKEKNIQRALLQPSDWRNRKRLLPLLKKWKKTYLLRRPPSRKQQGNN